MRILKSIGFGLVLAGIMAVMVMACIAVIFLFTGVFWTITGQDWLSIFVYVTEACMFTGICCTVCDIVYERRIDYIMNL